MSMIQLLQAAFGFGLQKRDAKEVINGARNDLDSIGSVFRTTINNYRNHAQATKEKAVNFGEEAKRLREAELKARKAEVDLLNIANQAEEMASKIESSLGFSMEKAA